MRYSRRLLAAVAIIAGLGMGAMGVDAAFAAQSDDNRGMENLVEAIADKFQVSVSDVQAVFDEQRAQMEADREAMEAERLVQAATDGKITQAQADAITVKREEMKDAMATFASLDEEARREAMKTQMDELQKWAKENNISLFYLHQGSRGGMRGHGPDRFRPLGEESEIPE